MLDLKSQRPSDSSEGKSFATPSPVKVENDSMYRGKGIYRKQLLIKAYVHKENLDNYDITPQPQSDKIVVESKVPPVDTLVPEVPRNEWPFETVCEHLCMDLFDPSWEIRHGAGIGLRSVLKSQGSGAAKAGRIFIALMSMSREQVTYAPAPPTSRSSWSHYSSQ
jgi:TATA-binding protein-associated factor